MLAHTADRQQLGSSPGFTFQEVGVCVVPINQEETRSLEIFDIVYSVCDQTDSWNFLPSLRTEAVEDRDVTFNQIKEP